MSRSLLEMKETPRNRKQKPSPSVTTAGEERETPRRLKIKPRNLKEKQEAPKEKPRRYSKENSSSYPQVTEKLRNLKIKPNNLEEKAPSSSARVENHIFNFRLDVQRTNQGMHFLFSSSNSNLLNYMDYYYY